MPRLLLICEYPTISGGEQSMLATLGGVRSAGYDVRVACPPAGPLANALRQRDVPVVPFSVVDANHRRLVQRKLRELLRTLIAGERPELVHANSLSMSRLAGPVTESLRLPSIGHLRDIVRLSRTAVSDVNRQQRLLAVSHATREFHVRAGVDAAITHVLHNGVCLREFRPRPNTGWLHDELGLPRHARLVATIGQIGVRKGLDLLLRAAQTVVTACTDVFFLIFGERQSGKTEAIAFERQLRRTAAAGPLAGRVLFLGRRDNVAAIFNELTLLVHPARQEPFGRVLLEAAGSAVGVVATDVGGTREVFGADRSPAIARQHGAILVPPEDDSALAKAVLQILQSPDSAAHLGAAARRWAERSLDVRGTVRQLLAHYDAVLPRM
jgi:glycosyltransferase involved in cell wall biosynthesis